MNILQYIAQETQLDASKVNIPKIESAGQLDNIRGLVYTTIAAVAVLIITIAGVQYILSQGDPQKTAKAKNTILYTAIGFVIAILASSIVMFVITELTD